MVKYFISYNEFWYYIVCLLISVRRSSFIEHRGNNRVLGRRARGIRFDRVEGQGQRSWRRTQKVESRAGEKTERKGDFVERKWIFDQEERRSTEKKLKLSYFTFIKTYYEEMKLLFAVVLRFFKKIYSMNCFKFYVTGPCCQF